MDMIIKETVNKDMMQLVVCVSGLHSTIYMLPFTFRLG